MSMGHRVTEQQAEFWLPTADLPHSPGHVFYDKLNRLLAEAGFDRHVEELCQPHYADGLGRESIPPGVYFRMLFVGYFEGLDSLRAIAWRCSDSFSLRAFLGIPLPETTPDHSSLTKIRERLPLPVHEHVFAVVPGSHELDFKKLARAAGARKTEMVSLKDVQPLTGYMRGGVTVFGAKKDFPVFADETIELFDFISVSAGQRGVQVLLAPQDYLRAAKASVADLTKGQMDDRART